MFVTYKTCTFEQIFFIDRKNQLPNPIWLTWNVNWGASNRLKVWRQDTLNRLLMKRTFWDLCTPSTNHQDTTGIYLSTYIHFLRLLTANFVIIEQVRIARFVLRHTAELAEQLWGVSFGFKRNPTKFWARGVGNAHFLRGRESRQLAANAERHGECSSKCYF